MFQLDEQARMIEKMVRQWCETKEKDGDDRNRDGKREYGKTNSNLFSARHAIGRKQQQDLQPRECKRYSEN